MHKSTIVKNTIVESLSVILAALMLTACGANTNTETDVKVFEETEIVEATPEETSEVQSTPKENNSEAVEKPVVTAPVEEEEVDDEIFYISVESSEDAMTNLLAEGKDANDYSSAKDYIEKVKARGMGDTLSDTLAVFNRCGFEYCGYDVSDLEMSLWKDDDFSEKVIITADGDILYYLRTGYSGRANDLKSGYQDYKLWRINDDKQYEIVKYDSSVGYRLFTDYYYVDNKFPLSPEEEEMVDQSIKHATRLELRLMKNSVYASKGRKFTSPDLKAIYEAQSWYHGTIEPNEFDSNIEKYLSKEEQAYINKIVKREREYEAVTEVNRDVEPSDFEYCKTLINGSYIDVNGDNKKDRLLWGWEDCFSLNVYVQLADGPEISLNHEGQSIYYEVCYINSVYLGNCLMTSDYGDSDDACTHMYTISGNDCISHGSVYVYPQEIKFYNDHIVAGFRGYHISTEEIRTDYILDANGEFVEHSDGFYEYRGNTVKALVDIQTFATNDETTPGIIISKNSDLVFLGGDLEKWIKVRDVKSDTECWLMTNGEDIVFPDGTQIYAFEAMEGIIIYD